MLYMVNMPLKGEVGGYALNSHENYIVHHGKSWKNHRIVFLNFCGNPVIITQCAVYKISIFQLVYVAEQAGLSLTWSDTPETGFLATRLVYIIRIMCVRVG